MFTVPILLDFSMIPVLSVIPSVLVISVRKEIQIVRFYVRHLHVVGNVNHRYRVHLQSLSVILLLRVHTNQAELHHNLPQHHF